MCGICGFMDLRGAPVDEKAGRRMMDLLVHRGPDGEGAWWQRDREFSHTPSVFLGHRRLKIIDLSQSAAQPLANEDQTVWVVFNGEVYNFRELRRDLVTAGHHFRSAGDTEAIVHGYESFGDDFVRYLDGMFALALWDDRQHRLILARDRTGKKPLYYTFDGTRFAFASEIKALLALPWVSRDIAPAAIGEFLIYGYIPTPRTLYAGIQQVPPASYLVVDGSGVASPVCYWRLEFSRAAKRMERPGIRQICEDVRGLLTASVERRLVSDVPLGALLSGGLDSTIVVGLISRLSSAPVRTFTIGFTDDLSYDERPFARMVARHFHTQHTDYVVQADAISLIDKLLWHHDQPFGDSSAIPTYLVSQVARRHVTVALNGDGGDEVFAGYDRFKAALIAARMPRGLTPVGRWLSQYAPAGNGYFSPRRRLQRFFEQAAATPEQRFMGWISIFDRSTLKELLRADLSDGLEQRIEDEQGRWIQAVTEYPLLHRLLELNFSTYLPDDLHVKMDRMSMANSLETRSPMLDTALLEYVAALSPDLKIRRLQMKYILRMAFREMIPRPILSRKKHGFGVPLNTWFRRQLRSDLDRTLLSPDSLVRAYVEQPVVRRLVQEHLAGARDHGPRLWALYVLERWLRLLDAGQLWKPLHEPAGAIDELTPAQTH